MTRNISRSAVYNDQRVLIAQACRVLAKRGLADGILGHISLRMPDETLLIRCRGPEESGLAFSTARDVRWVDYGGSAVVEGELAGGYSVPNELALHVEILKRRPDVHAVVHAHPKRIVAADLAGIAIRPIVGAFDIPGARLAAGGVPVYPRAVLVRNARLALEMVDAMGARPVVILRGHGLTSAADSVEAAVLQAISVDTIAGLGLQIASAGGQLVDLSRSDMDELPDLGGGFNVGTAWRHELARLDRAITAHE